MVSKTVLLLFLESRAKESEKLRTGERVESERPDGREISVKSKAVKHQQLATVVSRKVCL